MPLVQERLRRDLGGGFVLVGLHTCGDLGPTIVKLYSEMPDARALLSVGCCYMKLTEATFPQSRDGSFTE